VPKVIDHDSRRQEIAAAAMRVIERIGIEKTTVREIAREAGYSHGVLGHYFPNKQSVLIAAHRTAFSNAAVRIAKLAPDAGSLNDFRMALYESLPLDELRRQEAFVDISFWGHAVLDPVLREIRTQTHILAVAEWERRISAIRDSGQLHSPLSDHDLAKETMLLIDGLSAESLLHPDIMTTDEQTRIADNFIDRLVVVT
jgi:AcrR family transcriptional regulator